MTQSSMSAICKNQRKKLLGTFLKYPPMFRQKTAFCIHFQSVLFSNQFCIAEPASEWSHYRHRGAHAVNTVPASIKSVLNQVKDIRYDIY